MQQRFEQFIRDEHLFPEGEQVLIAVSGGRDSVVLTHLVHAAHIPFAIAHCNFNLRPVDCDSDEAFVRSLAESYGVPFFVAHFDTNSYAASHHLSVEEAARELRYRFFDQLLDSHHLAVVATAHHRDDAIETFFINLLRGTGLAGLQGIPVRNNRIVRPLLPFGRDEIDAYVAQHHLQYVDDCTNSQPLYLRNRIRLQLIPLLKSLSPSFPATMQSNMQHLADAWHIYQSAIQTMAHELLLPCREGFAVDIDSLRRLEPLPTCLFELLRPFGFTAAVVDDIAKSLDAQSGKQFLSPTHRLVKDRHQLILAPLSSAPDDIIAIDAIDNVPPLPVPLALTVAHYDGSPIRLDSNQAWFDLDRLHFPLRLRHWRNGDRIKPFGMQGSRLVSDLFSDNKISRLQKETAWLLTDADDNILWVLGMRASSIAPVSAHTSTVLKLVLSSDVCKQ